MSRMRLYLLVGLVTLRLAAQAQQEATNWVFGDKAGLTFGSGKPVAVVHETWATYNACAIQSNPKTGELLFYSNAEQVWGRNGQIMAHGNNLNGNSAITQACLIVPNPNDAQQFYLFTLTNLNRANGYDNTLSYSIIDMRLGNQNGDVVEEQKNQPVASGLSEKLTAVPHKNGRDYWVITHSWQGSIFSIYLVTVNGVQKRSDIAIGSDYTFSTHSSSNIGYMQSSPDGRKVACAVWKSAQSTPNTHPLDLFDFDAQQGLLSNYVDLGSFSRQYGVCFSPDNTKLYLTHQTLSADSATIDYLRQYDLEAGDAQGVKNSGMSVLIGNPNTNFPAVKKAQPGHSANTTFYAFALQNAPNGKMYGTTIGGFCNVEDCQQDYGHRFLVINRPNAKGFACDVQLSTLDLGAGSISNASGLPNFIQSPFNNLPPATDSVSDCSNARVRVYPNPASDAIYLQYEGDCFTPYQFSLLNLQGQKLLERSVQSASPSAISIRDLPASVYLVEILFEERKTVLKVIKQ